MYKKIFAYWKEESSREEITKLPRDFYESVFIYLDEKKKMALENTDNIFANIISEESNIIRLLLDDLFKLRIKKIVLLQTRSKSIPIEDLTNLELKFITSSIQKFGFFINDIEHLYKSDTSEGGRQYTQKEEKVLGEVIRRNIKARAVPNQKRHKHILIKINKNLPEITGADLKIYGPFKKGDIAHIPKINAKILLERKVAEKIELSKRD